MERKIIEQLPFDEIYKDLLQPSMRKAGEALATVFDGANLILLPLKLLNEKSRIYFKKNLESYSTKINKVENKTLIAVPQYVGLPVIDKLTYINQEDLSNAFINLLVKASFEETLPFVHPAYIDILNRISADEAQILFHIKDYERIPFININMSIDRCIDNSTDLKKIDSTIAALRDEKCGQAILIKHKTGLEKELNLISPQSITLYLENLQINGLISISKTIDPNDVERCEFLENAYSDDVNLANKVVDEVYLHEKQDEFKDYLASVNTRRGHFEFTELGKGFVRTCISDIIE